MPEHREKSIVEDYIVEQLQKREWKFVKELERESLEEPLLTANLIRSLKRLNSGIGIGDEEINRVVNELKLKSSGVEGVKQVLNFFKNGVPVKFEKERVLKYVRLFDFESFENNEFIATRQPWFQGKERRRLDIVLYVNGIPLVNIECKDPTNPVESWYSAYTQIKDYEKELPELYKYAQIGVAVCEVAKYFPIVPWQENVEVCEWRAELKDSIDSTIEMLSPGILLDLIRNFIFVREERGKTTKVVARYMQYRAVNRIVERVLKNLEGEEKKNRGLIWHWQGSGKTLEMIFSSNMLFKALGNPTIFFIVDRQELQKQLYEEYGALEIFPLPERIESVKGLIEVLSHGGGVGKRGIFIVLIQKFREEIHEEFKDLDPAIKNRKDIIVFADEGHRTHYGSLAARMREVFREAFFFGFTGTPLTKKGRDTYQAFSNPPDEKYLDRYFITDSIGDGFTLKIAYQPRLKKVAHLKKPLLEAFLDQEFEEIPEEIKETIEEKVKKGLTAIKLILKDKRRVKSIAKDIAEHFKRSVDGKFKAMVVAVDREACALYKRELDKLLPEEYSEIVMTFNRTDPRVIKEPHKKMREKYKGKEDNEIRKEIIDKFKEEEIPKILIVTDMLLTGFDAPILQTMYLDKPLKEHRLLQAIARTNRPYNDVKEAGLIVDYVGTFKELRKAFEAYTKEEIETAVYSMEDLREEFRENIREIDKIFNGIPRDYERDTLIKAFETLTADESSVKIFLEDYKKSRKLFELLGPDIIKAELFSEYKWISAVFAYYARIVNREKEFFRKEIEIYFNMTLKHVYQAIELEKIKEDLPLISFDENYLKRLEEKVKSKEERAANIVFTLNRFVLVERYKNPVYESVADKVERILKLWKEKIKNFEEIYNEGLKIIGEIKELSAKQKRFSFSDLEYSILLLLEKEVEVQTGAVKELVENIEKHIFPNWSAQQSVRKNVGREVRRFLRRYELKFDERERLYEKIMRCVENYGKTH